MVQIKHFTAPQKKAKFSVFKILGAPQRGQNIIVNQSKPVLVIVDKAFHSPEFQANLFFTRNWAGGFYWDSLLNI